MADDNSPATEIEEKLISSFTEITSSARDLARFYLENNNWDLDAALRNYNVNEVDDDDVEPNFPNPSDQQLHDARTRSSTFRINISDSLFSSLSPLRVRSRSLSRASHNPFGRKTIRRVGNIHTFADISDGDSDEQENSMPMVVPRVLTIWRNGFNIDDDPLETFDDPGNARFLEVIESLNSPRALDSMDGRLRFLINLIRRQEEDFPEPFQPFQGVGRVLGGSNSTSTERLTTTPPPSMEEDFPEPPTPFQPFQGVGRTLAVSTGPPASSDSAPPPSMEEDFSSPKPFQGVGRALGGNSVSTDPPASPDSLTTTHSPSMDLVVDPAAPTTSIQLRLADGTRIVSQFNTHLTVRDIRGFIDASRPGGSNDYQLLITGFPPTPLTDLDQTIEEAGISNSVLIKKL